MTALALAALDIAAVLVQDGTDTAQQITGEPALPASAAAALAVGLGALGTGYAQRGIGSAAVGAVAEDDDMLVPGLIFTVIPETLIIIAFVTILLA